MVLTEDLVNFKQRHIPSEGIVRSKVDIICNNVGFFLEIGKLANQAHQMQLHMKP